MRRDPVVEEVRKHRAAIAREHGNDLAAIVAAFQREDAASDVTTVSFPPKRVVKRALRRKSRTARQPKKALQPTRRTAKAGGPSKKSRRAARV